MNGDTELGRKLQEARENAGLLQRHVAREFGVSTKAVSRWETGQHMPDLATVAVLARIYRVSIDSLAAHLAGPVPPKQDRADVSDLADKLLRALEDFQRQGYTPACNTG